MKVSPEPVRQLSWTALGLPPLVESEISVLESIASDAPDPLPMLPDDDQVLGRARELMDDGFAGVILTGPPGTSKSWYARRLAGTLCDGDASRVRFVQFHPSYQYEDFIETYQPTESGGFASKQRIFLDVCDQASASGKLHILVIDELSRSDAVRVFGETLTYLEKSQRGLEFELASGRQVSIPSNLFIIATMNPWDRGVDELDMAFERRFAKVQMDLSEALLKKILSQNKIEEALAARIVNFFRVIEGLKVPYARIGHAYFARVRDLSSLERLWDHQLYFHFQKAFKLLPSEFEKVAAAWNRVIAPPAAEVDAAAAPAQA